MAKANKVSVSQQIVDLAAEGKTPPEIAKKLKLTKKQVYQAIYLDKRKNQRAPKKAKTKTVANNTHVEERAFPSIVKRTSILYPGGSITIVGPQVNVTAEQNKVLIEW